MNSGLLVENPEGKLLPGAETTGTNHKSFTVSVLSSRHIPQNRQTKLFYVESNCFPVSRYASLLLDTTPPYTQELQEKLNLITYKGGSDYNSFLSQTGVVNFFGVFITLQ